MKILNTTQLAVVGKAEPTQSRDGNNTYYRIACLQNGQACNLSVSEEVYFAIPSGFVEVELETSYDDKYQSFKVERLLQILSVNGQKPENKPGAKAEAPANK